MIEPSDRFKKACKVAQLFGALARRHEHGLSANPLVAALAAAIGRGGRDAGASG